MSFVIRPSAPGELELICDRLAAIDPWLKLDITAEKLQTACKRDTRRLIYVVAEETSEIAGTMMFRPTGANEYLAERHGTEALLKYHNLRSTQELPEAGYINVLCVYPENQGRGFGKALLNFTEQQCGTSSRYVYLLVSDFNKDAQRFYRENGYDEIGRIPDLIKVGLAELIMAKALS